MVAQRADGAAILFSSTRKFTSAGMIDYLTDEWAPRLQMADAETIDVNGMEAATGSGQLEGTPACATSAWWRSASTPAPSTASSS